jgi:2,3-bisphosphoglycerate-independent phosphoglycerate mutase
MKRPPLLLIVLDGWGHREAAEHNAIAAHAPYWHELLAKYPHTLLSASGKEVGLPLGLMGNSEVGHLNLGAGRVVYQDQTRIHKSIDDGDFFENGAFVPVLDRVRAEGKKLHLMGLVGTGGVHASNKHIKALLELAARQGLDEDQVVVHAILDGRDTPPRSGAEFLEDLEDSIGTACVGRIGSVIGRYWAMDRDKRWERVQRAFDLFVRGEGQLAATAAEAIGKSYEADTGDEFCEPFVIGTDHHQDRLRPGDALICFNFRADRMREITEALGHHTFDGFERGDWPVPKAGQSPADAGSLELVTMTQYRDDLPFAVAYPPTSLVGIFPELVSAAGLRQARIAETEKYAHVTFFFSGGREAAYAGEERILVPSPRVATYDLQPEMSCPEVTEKLVAAIKDQKYDFIVCNIANPDMVGHTGILEAAIKAVETVDAALGALEQAIVAAGGEMLITADHGNLEDMWDEDSGQANTQHSTNPVPLVYVGRPGSLRSGGALRDIAPTVLALMDLPQPSEMTGETLVQLAPVEH